MDRGNNHSFLGNFILAIIIFSGFITVGCSKDYSRELEKCKVNFSERNYSDAFEYCKGLAEQGYADAQYKLGFM